MLNLDEGGRSGKRSQETIEKMRIASTGNKNMLGKRHSDETKAKISKTKTGKDRAWNLGIPWSDEVKKKMYKFPKGHIPYNKGKEHKIHTTASKKAIGENSKKHWDYRKANGILLKNQEFGNIKNAKLNDTQVIEIKKLLAIKTCQRVIAEKFWVSGSIISCINTGRTWKHIKS